MWLAALFALLCLPLLLSTRETNYTWDEASYHLPAVRQIYAHWPALDLKQDSLSATAPGYHYFLAGVAHLTGTSRLALRLVNFVLSLSLLIVFCTAQPAGQSRWFGALIVMPLACSNFFVKSASYLVTDNTALLTIAGTLLCLFFSPSPRGSVVGSLLSATSVFIRQSGIWLAAPLACRLLGEPNPMRRLPLLLLPGLTLGWLFLAWGGLVPPEWQLTLASRGLVPAAGAYILSTLALFGPAYYLALRPREWPEDLFSRWTIAGLVIGTGFALAGANAPNHDAGRWGGYLWELAVRLPTLGVYSSVFLILSPLGGAMLGVLARRLWHETTPANAVTWMAAFAAWMASSLSNRQIFHRYYEPTLLVMLICWLFLVIRRRSAESSLMIGPLAVVGGVQLVLTLVTAYARTFGR
jgi:hypothetical protein